MRMEETSGRILEVPAARIDLPGFSFCDASAMSMRKGSILHTAHPP